MESSKANTTLNVEAVDELFEKLIVESKVVDERESDKTIRLQSYKFLKGCRFKYVITVSNENDKSIKNIILKENLPLSVTIHSKEVIIEDIRECEKLNLKIPFLIDENIFSINLNKLNKNQSVRITIPFTINY